MKDRLLALLTSKTFWSGVVAAGGYLTTVSHIGPGEIAIALGMIVGAAGIKDNFNKLGADDVR